MSMIMRKHTKVATHQQDSVPDIPISGTNYPTFPLPEAGLGNRIQ
jgi:hypothetical protein